MTSLNIFDVFGRQKICKSLDENTILKHINIDEKLDNLKQEFNDGAKKMFENLKDHVKKTEDLVNSILVSKNYIGLNKKKRIVGVKPGIDKNDVIVKEQLEKLEKEINSILSNLNTTIKNFVTTEKIIEFQNKLNESLHTLDQNIKQVEQNCIAFETSAHQKYAFKTVFNLLVDDVKSIKDQLDDIDSKQVICESAVNIIQRINTRLDKLESNKK